MSSLPGVGIFRVCALKQRSVEERWVRNKACWEECMYTVYASYDLVCVCANILYVGREARDQLWTSCMLKMYNVVLNVPTTLYAG